MTLKNKTALVTGGSRGIGAAIVRRLAKDGANVAFTYSQSADAAEKLAKEISAYGVKAKAYRADAAKPEQLPKLADEVVKDFVSLDILVNNAGVFTLGLIGEISQEDYAQVMRVNVDAVFMLTNAAVKHMKAGARIINISSILGERACDPNLSVYVGSKFAVSGLTRAWAKDLGPKGILVNAVMPGPIDTDMNPASGEYADAQRVKVALGRYGKPEEIAGAVVFLAGPDSTFITGTTLTVDGGYNA